MPNLENLRKQAKLVLRWHRDRYYPVAAQIRSGLPRFSHLADSEILAQSFKLSDAQELVARQHGFESWQALKTGLPPMSDHAEKTSTKPVITAAEPQLFVTDIKASCDFFTAKLGFAVVFSYGAPPFYAQVKRDGASINLRHVDQPVIDANLRDREELLSASFTVATTEEIKQLFLELQAADVTFVQALKKQPWGAREFHRQGPGRQPAAVRRTGGVVERDVILRSRALARRLEGWPRVPWLHPSRLAEDGEHLRMTAVHVTQKLPSANTPGTGNPRR
jgi:catechol 2,3-dioxygenase-like lactoylglutathione lyase family enzyme